jgi:transcriptional activator protein Pur-alpha
MIEFRDALTDLLEEFGTDDGGFKGELPEGRHMRVENKNFYFDIGQNNRGIYMRISEVRTELFKKLCSRANLNFSKIIPS